MIEVAVPSSKPNAPSISTNPSDLTISENVSEERIIPKMVDDINMSAFLTNFRPILDNIQWYIGHRNTLKAWMSYKSECAGKCNSEGLSIENDPQAIL
jgi:hypothetical protein